MRLLPAPTPTTARRLTPALAAAVLLTSATAATARQGVTPELLLNRAYQPPAALGVQVETPTGKDVAESTVEQIREGKGSGYLLTGPQGQVLRRFLDTDGNGQIDQFRYYDQGLEVFRQQDTDGDGKNDDFRWLNFGGTRWGRDTDGDGKIDAWRRLTPEEAGRVAVEAMLDGNVETLNSVLVSEADLRGLGVRREIAEDILERVGDPAKKLAELRGGNVLSKDARWDRFDGSRPGLIPASDGKAEQDLMVYEDTMGLLRVGREVKLVVIGELVQVGDVWKLTGMPQPVEEGNMQIVVGGPLMQPAAGLQVGPDQPGLNPQMVKLLNALAALNKNVPPLEKGNKAAERYANDQADLFRQMYEASKGADRVDYFQNLVEHVSGMYRLGIYPQAQTEIRRLLVEAQKELSNEVPFVKMREFQMEDHDRQQAIAGQQNNEKARGAIKEWRTEWLEQFVRDYPKSEQAARAHFELAMQKETDAESPDDLAAARDHYRATAQLAPQTAVGVKSAGALYRLTSEGKPVDFTFDRLGDRPAKVEAKNYRGKVLLITFGNAQCGPCTNDLPNLQALERKYGPDGFEILTVALDPNPDVTKDYIKQNLITWPVVFEPGSYESDPAMKFGVVTLPLMILVGEDGRVINNNATVAELKQKLPALLK